MITVHGVKYTKAEVLSSIETLKRKIKTSRELVLETVVCDPMTFAKEVLTYEAKITALEKLIVESEA